MLNTGERFHPDIDGAVISYEHWHRYCIASQFVAGKTVLDVAAGEGYGSALLGRTAAAVTGVDLDPEAVAHARRKYPQHNLTFLPGSASEIPIPGRHLFDVIVSFETIEHLTSDSQHRFAAEITRLLKPNGLLLMSTPDRLIYTEKNQHHNPFHLQEFSLEEFSAYLAHYFSNVRLLCQRVYPCSYIWDPLETPTRYTEYQLELSNGGLEPVLGDHKENLYLVALCSNGPIAPPGNSLLLDLDELATRSMSAKPRGFTSTLFKDTGAGFRVEERVPGQLPAGPGQFRLSFDLDGSVVRGLRWDPLELHTCRIRIDAIAWTDLRAVHRQLDLTVLTGNGERSADGLWDFETLDPSLFLPIFGDVARVTVEGWYEADDLSTSLARVDRAAHTAKLHLRDREEQIRAREEQIRARDEQIRALEGQVRARDEQIRTLTEAEERARQLTSTLYLDTGAGFRGEERIAEVMPAGPGRFRLRFALAGVSVRSLRWDPLEYRTCRLRLEKVEWEDTCSLVRSLELETITGNGARSADGLWDFETLDPVLLLPISGDVACVTVEGWYEADDLGTSLMRVDRMAQTAKAQLEALETARREKSTGYRAWLRQRLRV